MRYPRFSKKITLKNAFYYCCYNLVKINFFFNFFFSDTKLKTLQNGQSDFWKNVYMLTQNELFYEYYFFFLNY